MKMKSFKYFLICFVICLSLSACGSMEKTTENKTKEKGAEKIDYKSKLIGKIVCEDGDTDSGSVVESEVEIWNSQNASGFVALDGQKTQQIEFMGNIYEGQYAKTHLPYWIFENYFRKTYEIEYGKFDLHEQSGKVVRFLGVLPVFNRTITKEEAKSKFEEMANELISKDQYTFEEDYSIENAFSFNYKRYINGISTSELFSATFDNAGNCWGYNYIMIDEFNAFFENHNEDEILEMAEALDSDQAVKLVEDKIESVLGKCDSYEIKNKVFTVLENESLALVYQVEVDLSSDANSEYDDYKDLYVVITF